MGGSSSHFNSFRHTHWRRQAAAIAAVRLGAGPALHRAAIRTQLGDMRPGVTALRTEFSDWWPHRHPTNAVWRGGCPSGYFWPRQGRQGRQGPHAWRCRLFARWWRCAGPPSPARRSSTWVGCQLQGVFNMNKMVLAASLLLAMGGGAQAQQTESFPEGAEPLTAEALRSATWSCPSTTGWRRACPGHISWRWASARSSARAS